MGGKLTLEDDTVGSVVFSSAELNTPNSREQSQRLSFKLVLAFAVLDLDVFS